MAKTNYEKYLIKKPIREAGPRYELKNRMNPSMTYMSAAQVPEVKYYIEFGWVWGIPKPNPHTPEHVHKFNEIILHIGGDGNNPEDLGAEVECVVGGQPLTFDTTSALFIPKYLRHGPLTWKKFRRPHIQMTITLGTGSMREGWVDINSEEAKKEMAKQPTGVNYAKYLVRKPVKEVVAGMSVKNRPGGSSTLMNNNLVPGSNIYIEGGWVLGMPDPNPHIFEHAHDYEEIVVHFGSDYQNPEDLGGEIDFYVDGKPLKFDKTSALYVPRGIKHGPLVWKKFSRPHLEMAIMPGAGTLAQADPGGHIKRREKK
jgi:hypothetical protein